MKTKKEYNRPQIEVIELVLEETIVTASSVKSQFSADKEGVGLQETNSFWNKNNFLDRSDE